MKKSKWDNFKRYYTLDTYLKHKFNSKVAKISLNAGFTCPNIDGKVGYGGCIYCSNLGSGDFAGNSADDLPTQFHNIKIKIDKKWPNSKYIGYFQAHTNTYAPLNVLKEKYETILKEENVVGLAIATRPDSLDDNVINYLEELSQKTYIQVELGLQTIHDKTSIFINRCHTLSCFNDAVMRLREKNINVVVHIINGLPYETKDMMIETAKYLNNLDIQGIKIHMLNILKNTKLAKIYEQKTFHILTKEEYIDIVCDQLEYLRDDIVIHRITADPNIDDLIEPTWIEKKLCILNDIDKELDRRNTYQGFNLDKNNLIKKIISPILKENSYVLDDTNNYTNLLKEYIKTEYIVANKEKYEGKITCIITTENTKDVIDYYLNLLHNRGFILIITDKYLSIYNDYNSTKYYFKKELSIVKIDKKID